MKEQNILLEKSYAFAIRTVKLYQHKKKKMVKFQFLTNNYERVLLLAQIQKKPSVDSQEKILFLK